MAVPLELLGVVTLGGGVVLATVRSRLGKRPPDHLLTAGASRPSTVGRRLRVLAGSLMLIGGVFAVVGCGPSLYLVQVSQAEEQLEQARQVSADTHAPLEYFSAEAYLEKAKEEAGEGHYEVALRLVRAAAERASQAGRRATGRPEVVAP